MRHAYLILAHNEFPILRKLITLLDDDRNDIFIHYDKKVKTIPEIPTLKSNIFIIEKRIDVRWADVSVVEAELNLFEYAYNKNEYEYFHLLSGVDLPIKSQNEIYHFFESNAGKEFIGFYQGENSKEIVRKVQKFHLFPKSFRETQGIINLVKRLIRSSSLFIQDVLNYKRNRKVQFKKGTQWLSITKDLVELVLSKKNDILQQYAHSFCPDEIFIQTICWNSEYKKNIYNSNNEGLGCMRFIQWKNNQILDWESKDFDILVNSPYLFARKFSTKDLNIVNKLVKHFST